jgi:hypothetical protein
MLGQSFCAAVSRMVFFVSKTPDYAQQTTQNVTERQAAGMVAHDLSV